MYTNTMGNVTQVARAFDGVNGIDVNTNATSGERVLVKVMEEDSVGNFFQQIRNYDLDYDSLTRAHLNKTVMDAWVYPEE
jgi:hypothetical protein